MYILGISGSPRGSQSTTRVLIERVLEGAQQAGAQTEFIDICKLKVDYCTGCGACHVTGKCPIKDEFAAVREKLLGADGIVLGSPLYFNSVTAQLKAGIDRLSMPIHCQMLLGKYACSVASAGAPEPEIATDYMNEVLMRLGATVVGAAGVAPAFPGAMEAAEAEALALGSDLVKAISEKRAYPDQDELHAEMHARFKHLVGMNKDHWPYEYNYWTERGWL